MAYYVSNDCVGCATSSYPCLGSECDLRHVMHYVCDKCGDEVEELYRVDGSDICYECAHDKFFDSLEVVHYEE